MLNKQRKFCIDAAVWNRDECLLWPFAVTDRGYPLTGWPRRMARQVVCEMAHGPKPENHMLVQTCGNKRCLSPLHLCWRKVKRPPPPKTVRNGKWLKGEENKNAKLTEDTVREIRHLYATGSFTQQMLVDSFGVSCCAISRIIARRTWKHIP